MRSLESKPLRSTIDATFPFWSPDGKYIGYFDSNNLKKVLATGGPSLTVCPAENGRGGTWNQDNTIVFSPAMSGLLYRVSAGGGKPEVVMQLDTAAGDYTHRWPSFLPDGDHFLYFARTTGEAGGERDAICVASLSTGERRRLFNARSSAEYSDGHIIYLQNTTLMAQPFDVNSLKLTGDVFPIAENVTYLENWSRGVFSATAGGMIAYRSGAAGQASQLLIFDTTGAVVDSVGAPLQQKNIDISTDGSLVAAELFEGSAPNPDIWIYDRKRSLKTRLTFSDYVDALPMLSPDNRFVVYRTEADSIHMYVKDISGASDARLLLTDTVFVTPDDWTRDGKYIVYDRLVSGGNDLYAIAADGSGDPIPLIISDFWESNASVSPDGRWMVYTSDESGTDEIYVTTFPKPSGKWQISIRGGDAGRWSDDGRRLFYLSADNTMTAVDVDGTGQSFRVGGTKPLFRTKAVPNSHPADVFNNGKNFIVNTMVSTEVTKSIVLMQNWRAGVKH